MPNADYVARQTRRLMSSIPTYGEADVLLMLQKNGASQLSNRTWPGNNLVHWRLGERLARSGEFEIFLGGDGQRWIRQVHIDSSGEAS